MYNFGHGISFKLDIFIVTQLNDDSNVWLGISTEVEISRKCDFYDHRFDTVRGMEFILQRLLERWEGKDMK